MRNGFTLMELLGVIVILSLLMLIAVPTVLNQVSNKETEINEAYKETIISAGQLYFDEHPNFSENKISITTLRDEGYLTEEVVEELGTNYDSACIVINNNQLEFNMNC